MSQAVNTLYTVAIGDSLSKLAARFYGDASKYPMIAERNSLKAPFTLMINQRLIIPPLTTIAPSQVEEVQVTNAARIPDPSSAPTAGLVPATGGIETITTTASVWYKDWRYWAAIGAGAVILWYITPKLRR